MVVKNIACNRKNYGDKRSADEIKFIVIHYVGGEGGSEANGNYFKNNETGASAHYFVGHDGEMIVSSVPEEYIAWSVGTAGGAYKQIHPVCRNSNSISIELCCWKKNGEWVVDDKTVYNTLVLTRELMKKYNIKKENVLRHKDVVSKNCPAFWLEDSKWKKEFLNKLDDIKEKEYTPSSNITKNSSEKDVKWLQSKLNKYGKANLDVDGDFGQKTSNSLVSYWKQLGWNKGDKYIAGEKTINALADGRTK